VSKAQSLKDIVLVGGGHAHVLVIRQYGMKPFSGVRLTLVSPQLNTPYSGMLPGLVAGHYEVDDIHIDLNSLCQWAGVQFFQGAVNRIDQESKSVSLSDGESYQYDLLSIDVGSTPDHSTPGVKDFAVPVKPIAEFYRYWQQQISFMQSEKHKQVIAVVGGGAGSVEIILSMAHFLESNPVTSGGTRYKLLYQNEELLTEYPLALVKKVKQACRKFGVECYPGFSVERVEKNTLISRDGIKESFDFLFWCTQASAANWLASSGFSCNESGFIRVNANLQTIDNPDVFAAGDIAHMDENPRPKAGVYAVRQGPYLYENLKRRISGESLLPYKPQNHFLSLLALGDRKAVGVRYPLPSFSGAWVWRWKDRIDRKFMAQFENLPHKKNP
jgi:selenide,water dikinase